MVKQQVLQIRLADEEKEGFQQAAELAGIPLSSWVRERLRLAAIRDLESAGQKIPFVSPVHLGATDA
jgi:antitoxin component of RelBE/YafQ-DinJ toxin-antitoxin module